jgi:hypothetical protein
MTYRSPLLDITSDNKDPQLLPYTTEFKWRKLATATAIPINGRVVSRYQAPNVTEYIDVSTGEIIKASALRHDPRVPPQIHVGEIMLLRQDLMHSLRKEVRAFAFFVLQFRNNRRGVTPEVDTLVEWYADMHRKRASNVRRYVTVLQEAGFLAGESLLSPLFQRTGKTVTSKDHLGEDVVARARLLTMRVKATSAQTSSP